MLDTEIREEIQRYIAGTIDAGDLEVWLTEVEDRLQGEPEVTHHLARDAARLVFERMNGDWTDAELTVKLRALSQTYWLLGAPKVFLSSSSEVIQQGGRQEAAGRPPEVAYV